MTLASHWLKSGKNYSDMIEGEVVIQREPRRYLEKLPLAERQRILDALQVLQTGEFSTIDVKPLQGRPGWRLRVGSYRVLFLVDLKHRVYLVTKIGSRGDIYKK